MRDSVGVLIAGVVVLLCIAACFICAGCGVVNWFARDAVDVAKEELSPHTLLRKYEWFKDCSAQLDAKNASIKVYSKRFANLKTAYDGAPRSKWSREDREQANLWEQELAGIRASFNSLAAEYNAQMAKENWRFCEAGRLPEGASTPLPREYKPYNED